MRTRDEVRARLAAGLLALWDWVFGPAALVIVLAWALYVEGWIRPDTLTRGVDWALRYMGLGTAGVAVWLVTVVVLDARKRRR